MLLDWRILEDKVTEIWWCFDVSNGMSSFIATIFRLYSNTQRHHAAILLPLHIVYVLIHCHLNGLEILVSSAYGLP